MPSARDVMASSRLSASEGDNTHVDISIRGGARVKPEASKSTVDRKELMAPDNAAIAAAADVAPEGIVQGAVGDPGVGEKDVVGSGDPDGFTPTQV
jgi:hypothetical protein